MCRAREEGGETRRVRRWCNIGAREPSVGYQVEVSLGCSREQADSLDAMMAEPFETFAFAPAGAAVYQLGPFGTAARRLHNSEVTA